MAAKKPSIDQFTRFYVFKQIFIYESDLESVLEHIEEHIIKSKEASWYTFWETQGEQIVTLKWKKKYRHYISDAIEEGLDTQVVTNQEDSYKSDSNEEEPKIQGAEHIEEKNLLESDTSNEEAQEITLTWQELWDQLIQTAYAEEYTTFERICDNYSWELKEALQSEPKTNARVYDLSLDFNEDFEQLKLAGLPTAFGSSSVKQRREKYRRNNSESEASSSDTITESEYSDEITTKTITEMPRTSQTTQEGHKASGSEEHLHKTQRKVATKATSKRKVKHKLSKVPQIILEDSSLRKYWFKRFSLFARFDEGIRLDRESWFSVTPEKVAQHMAKRLACDVIVDGFCGCGGNAIQFAMTCNKVIAIDIDPNKIEMARHNASIYGVADKIEFIVGDFLDLSASGDLKGDIVFLSPPWGGPEYTSVAEYCIEEHLEPVGASQLMALARNISNNIALFLPRHSKIKQIIRLAGAGNFCEIENNYLDTRLVGLTAFYGNDIIK